MVWNAPVTWTVGQTVTAAQLNAQIRDNLNETSVAKTTTVGSYTVGTAANAIAERTLGHAFTSAVDTTASVTYDDLAGGANPVISGAATGTKAILFMSVSVANSTVNALSVMSADISGATTVAANDAFRVGGTSATANANVSASNASLLALTAGSNTATAKYKVSAGTGSFGARRLILMSF